MIFQVWQLKRVARSVRVRRYLLKQYAPGGAVLWENFMDKYACIPCGYVYDPEQGDPDGGIPKGTPFDQLPEDWACPICGASKDAFEKK